MCVCDRTPQYGAVLLAVVAVNVPIVLIIIFFTAILLSLRRQLGKHEQQASRHQQQQRRSTAATMLSSSITCGDTWDSDEMHTVEMTEVTSQAPASAATFYFGHDDSSKVENWQNY